MSGPGMFVEFPFEIRKALTGLTFGDRNRIMNGASREAANEYKEELIRLEPVATGAMRQATKAKREYKREVTSVIYRIFSGKFYLRFLNDGTKYIGAQHMLERAKTNADPRVAKIMEYRVAVGIEAAWKRNAKK